MDIGLAFSFVFKDPEWFKKVAIPALCSLIPVIRPLYSRGLGGESCQECHGRQLGKRLT